MVGFGIKGVAVVTGAGKIQHVDKIPQLKHSPIGSGIGRDCALAFVAEGAAGVVFADLESVKDMAAQALCTFGRIDYSVNSAGVSKVTDFKLKCSNSGVI